MPGTSYMLSTCQTPTCALHVSLARMGVTCAPHVRHCGEWVYTTRRYGGGTPPIPNERTGVRLRPHTYPAHENSSFPEWLFLAPRARPLVMAHSLEPHLSRGSDLSDDLQD